jgi:RNA polymerase sigma factor (sigma-70 family)
MSDYVQLSDIELIEKCLEEDAEAWELLIRRYQRLIASITVKFGLNSEDSADVFQAVCFTLLKQLPDLRDQARLSSWLITVTVRECWKLRHRRPNVYSLDDPEWEWVANTQDQAQQSVDGYLLKVERQHLIRRSIEMLSPQCRNLLEHLFYAFPPTPYAEISRQLNIPVASIGPIRGRCLAKLREYLKKYGFE